MKIGAFELIVILAVVVIIFGPTQLPKLAKMFGNTAKSFKEGLNSTNTEDEHKSE